MRSLRRLGPALFALSLLALPTGVEAQCDAPIDLGRGEVMFHVPPSYDPEVPTPLVLLLHGRGTSPRGQERYMGFTPMADRYGYLYAVPSATPDPGLVLTWNATDACCDFGRTNVDDSGYLRELIEAIEAQCNVDPRKIYFTGHSNGGFMAYRMACDHADRVAAIAPLAGATYLDPEDCSPSEPVHVLHLHGTRDNQIRYEGGTNNSVGYPGAFASAEIWADYDRCSVEPVESPKRLDLDNEVEGAETVMSRYTDSCRPGGSAEVWTLEASGHVPDLNSDYARSVSEFLLAHPKPGECNGKERVVAKKCSAANKLILKLRGGLAQDGYRVELSSGESVYGVLNSKGRAKVRLKKLQDGTGSATITYGCGAIETKDFDCD